MLSEKVVRLGVNLVVGIWLARYLGPSDFGILHFAIAIAAIFGPLVNFGLQGILVKELYLAPGRKNELLGSSFAIKLVASLIVFAAIVLTSFTNFYTDKTEWLMVIVVSSSLLFQPFLVIDSWYESQVKVRLLSILKTLFFLLTSLIKIIMILRNEPLIVFGIVYSLEALFLALALVLTYAIQDQTIFKWRIRLDVVKNLIGKSWLLVLSGLSAVIYLKIDQVMLGIIVSDQEVGIYSAAVKLSEAWYFIPLILSNALFPAILSSKIKGQQTYRFRLQQLCDLYFLISLLLAIVVSFLANFIIVLLYGVQYDSSALILQVHIWAGIFIFLRSVLSKWLIAEDKYKFSLISQLSGAVVNVLLNLVLIPRYGGFGAAIATVISYSFTSLWIFAFFKETKEIFFIMLKSFTSPIRIFSKL